tara:strand:+ start:24 stop:467 length:444 start_codon:yes stop_codon:yes gene_type:complete
MREHQKFDEFAGPRFFVRLASLEMHPLDTENRIPEIKDDFGISYCNITRCCTEVCPAGIQITDNALIPLKERVVTEYFDPLVNPIKAVGNLTSGVLSYFSEESVQTADPGNNKQATTAQDAERARIEEAKKLESERTERARERFRSD